MTTTPTDPPAEPAPTYKRPSATDAHALAMQAVDEAMDRILEAARWEELATEEADATPSPQNEPSRSILYRSAAALYYRGGKPGKAKELARKGLAGMPPDGIRRELEAIEWVAQLALDGDQPYEVAHAQFHALMGLVQAADETLRWLDEADAVHIPELRTAAEAARNTLDREVGDYWQNRPRLWLLIAGGENGQVVSTQIATLADVTANARWWAQTCRAAVRAAPLAAVPTDVLAWPKPDSA